MPYAKGAKAKLKEHAKHHTQKHIKMMEQNMKKGQTFEQAHRAAKKKVGKLGLGQVRVTLGIAVSF